MYASKFSIEQYFSSVRYFIEMMDKAQQEVERTIAELQPIHKEIPAEYMKIKDQVHQMKLDLERHRERIDKNIKEITELTLE